MRAPYGLVVALVAQLHCLNYASAVPTASSSNINDSSQDHTLKLSPTKPLGLVAAITKRDWRLHPNLFSRIFALGVGWYLQYNYLDFIQPPAVPPITQLIEFYNDILVIGTHEWANEPAEPYRQITQGSIKLTFQSNADIPWLWLYEFLTSTVCALHKFCS